MYQKCTANVVTKGATWEAAHQLRNKAGGALSMCQHPGNHTKAIKQATEINESINPTAKMSLFAGNITYINYSSGKSPANMLDVISTHKCQSHFMD